MCVERAPTSSACVCLFFLSPGNSDDFSVVCRFFLFRLSPDVSVMVILLKMSCCPLNEARVVCAYAVLLFVKQLAPKWNGKQISLRYCVYYVLIIIYAFFVVCLLFCSSRAGYFLSVDLDFFVDYDFYLLLLLLLDISGIPPFGGTFFLFLL